MGGRRIGNCEVVEEIGQGGMATVYRAVQDALGRTVAIKELRTDLAADRQIAERFGYEARCVALLQHENIVAVYDHITRGAVQYIVMEYVEGIDIFDLLGRVERLPPEVAAIIGLQVARGLEYAHFRGVVHRDVKPSNLVISKLGEVKLMDFGIAKADALGDLTRPGVAVGTPAYMSPEQIMGARVDWRSDIFSFGVVLYQMLTGRKPFQEQGQRTVMQAILKDPYPPPRSLFPDIPIKLSRVVARCLHKEPEARYPSTEALRIDLEDFVSKNVRYNIRSRLIVFLHHRGLLTEAEASAVVDPKVLAEPLLAREDLSGSGLWKTRLRPVLTAAAVAFTAILLGAGLAELWPSSQPQLHGFVRVHAWPWAQVYIDDKFIDTTPFASPVPLKPGRHVVALRNPHFQEQSYVINVEPDALTRVDATLQRLAPEDRP